MNKGKIPDIIDILESNGIFVFEMDFETPKVDGISTITYKGYKVIFLNKYQPNDRKRFSLAHELGHMLMHIDIPPKYKELVEDEANIFASEFLMPRDEVLRQFNSQPFNIKLLADMKRTWHVSMRAVIRRALNLKFIDKEEYRKWQIIFSKKGYNKEEPIQLPTVQPSMIYDTISLYKNELEYSDKDLMYCMKLDETDYNSWFLKSLAINTKFISI